RCRSHCWAWRHFSSLHGLFFARSSAGVIFSGAFRPRTAMAAITFEDLVKQKRPVCVVGLGYVGLPLAVALSKKFPVVGFDVNQRRIDELKQGKDITGEVAAAALAESGIEFTADAGA